MNIKKYKLNSLLKFALIFSIVLGVVNSLSTKTLAENCKPTELKPNTEDQNPVTMAQLEMLQNTQNQCFKEILNQSKQILDKIPKKESEDVKKNSFSVKDSLIFINLPILTTLLLLWFLTQKKQQRQIRELKSNQNKIIGNFNQFNEINNKLNNLDKINRQIIEKIQESNQKNIDSEVRLRKLFSKQQFNQSANYHNSLTSNTSYLNSITIVDKVLQLVETYNQNKNSISDKAKFMVAETQASLNQRRSGSSDTVILENTSQKKYCIIEEDNNYYLLPHAKIKFDEFNKSTLESLFDCANITSDYHDFQLIKPAKVSQLSSETWQLETKGKLEFS